MERSKSLFIDLFFVILTSFFLLVIVMLAFLAYFDLVWFFTPSLIRSFRIQKQDSTALLLVIENDDNWNVDEIDSSIIRLAAFLIKPFEINKIKNLSTVEIVDTYFEDYLAKKIILNSHQYERIVYLTDESATYKLFLEQLQLLTDENFQIDVIFHLHGGNRKVYFLNNIIDSEDFLRDVSLINPKIRDVYQTLCYGSSWLDTWKQLGVENVNGAFGINHYVVFSPVIYSIEKQKGELFTQASETAYLREKEIYQRLSSSFNIFDFLTSEDVQRNSKHIYQK